MKMINLFLLLLLSLFRVGYSEVENIEISWNALKCLDICVPRIVQSLKEIPQISDIQTNPQTGIANMRWNPSSPFNYETLLLASSRAGIRFDEIRLRVTGSIIRKNDEFYLNSLGDNTQFFLLGPQPILPGHIRRLRRNLNPLTEDLKRQLIELERNQLVVIATGRLFNMSSAFNVFPLAIIIDRIQVDRQRRQISTPTRSQRIR